MLLRSGVIYNIWYATFNLLLDVANTRFLLWGQVQVSIQGDSAASEDLRELLLAENLVLGD